MDKVAKRLRRRSGDVAERFRADVRRHRMQIIRDAGLDRQIRFKRPKSTTYWFDLVTWRGRLVIDGDCGTYCFARLPDMFEFFRRPDGGVNAGYWEEKLLAADYRQEVTEFSPRVARAAFARAIEDWPPAAKRQAFHDLGTSHDDGDQFRKVVDEIEVRHGENTYRVADFWGYDLTEYSHSYPWNLHAIVWGIQQYDASKKVVV